MAKQLVLSGNRIIAHGEDCFLCMGGTVICPDTGKVYENATLAVCEGAIPADVDEVGYEYHAGQFIPCAPYGKGGGNIAVVCNEDCKSIKDSGVSSENLPNVINSGLIFTLLPNINLPSSGYTDITYGNGMFVAVKSGSGAYSENGDTWTEFNLPFSGSPMIAYGGGKFVVIPVPSTNTNSVAYSTDGITWTAATLPLTAQWKGLAYGNGMFVAVNKSGSTAYSTDGVTWIKGGSVVASSDDPSCMTYGNGMFVVGCTYGKTSYSTDGLTWTSGGAADKFTSITYGNGMFVAIGTNGAHYTSDVSAAWQKGIGFPDASFTDIDYGNGVFVAVSQFTSASSGKTAAYSTDGANWTETTLPENIDPHAIVHNEGRFIAVGGEAKALSSTDGKDWPVRGAYRIRLSNGADVTDAVKTVLGI